MLKYAYVPSLTEESSKITLFFSVQNKENLVLKFQEIVEDMKTD